MEEIKFEVMEDAERDVWLVHDAFWQALGDRDIEKRFSLCADTVTFIGSGLNEKAANKDEYIAINKKGIEQYPDKFDMQYLWRRVSIYENLALVETEVEWKMNFDGREEREMLRNTVVLKNFGHKWLILHVHGSMPDYRLSGQNYMTNAETGKRNMELERQVFQRTKELNDAMEKLRNTQSQLIQSEKMASLGELTAGIAHEIQNPLNFVNNFSEVSHELMDEMKDEFRKGDIEEGFVIAEDIKLNLEKIIHHGKRADSIVKGMLQHSRGSNGIKQPTDINALTDEYFRLSYHGLRAKDNTFNAEFKTDFDPNLPKVNVIPQDIGRVLLNLCNNAFQAVHVETQCIASLHEYTPTVTVSTKNHGGHIEISVRDNGPGIPSSIIDKIFQPFFTTKPTGQGTGLGLSLSYDIVKAHGGELKVETKEGEGSVFLILLPI